MNKIYKHLIVGFAAIFLTLSSTHSEAATLHAILIGDTLGHNIQKSVAKDLRHMKKEMELISQYSYLTLRERVFTGEIISSEIMNELEKIEVGTDDVIFFYFSGHGYREDSKENIWPNLYITTQNKGIDFKEVQEILRKKNAKFLLAMVDCCNNLIPDYYAPELMHAKAVKGTMRELLEQNYQRLFRELTGSIFVSSSSIGEYSWGSSYFGGLYTYNLLLSLHSAVKSEDPLSWDAILNEVREKLATDDQTPQTPQFQIDTHT